MRPSSSWLDSYCSTFRPASPDLHSSTVPWPISNSSSFLTQGLWHQNLIKMIDLVGSLDLRGIFKHLFLLRCLRASGI